MFLDLGYTRLQLNTEEDVRTLKAIIRHGFYEWVGVAMLFLHHDLLEEKRPGILMTPRYIDWLARRDGR